jgi:hypothetical protein
MIDDFPVSVLAHIDYPVRNWPTSAQPYAPGNFEGAAVPVSTRS